jgi:hypothetical protein
VAVFGPAISEKRRRLANDRKRGLQAWGLAIDAFFACKRAEHTDCGPRSALVDLVDEPSCRVGSQADAVDQGAPRHSPTSSATANFGQRRVALRLASH